MRYLVTAAVLFFGAAMNTASAAHRPDFDEPQDVYEVQITASWEGLGAIGATVADVTLSTPTSIYERRVLVGPVFTLEVLDPPPYTYTINGLWHLPTAGTSAGAEIEAGVQFVGDAPTYAAGDWVQGDGRVDVIDFSALQYWYGAERPCCAPAIYEQSTVDFDGDGTVGAADFSLFAANFGRIGP